jgi:parallel beta-helix repeat protein
LKKGFLAGGIVILVIFIAVIVIVGGGVAPPAVSSTYDITNYGAVPNDQNDDSGAFQRILSAHPSDIQIHVPSGTFLINSSIHLYDNNNNVTIYGEGPSSIIKLAAHDNMIRIEGAKNVTIRDLTLEGNSQYLGDEYFGINAGFYADGLQILNMYIHDIAGGIQVLASKNATINNCRIENIGTTNCSFGSGNPIILNTVDGARVTNNQVNGFFGNGGIGTWGSLPGFQMGNVLIDNNTVAGAHRDESTGINIGPSNNTIVTNNVVHDDQFLFNFPIGDVFRDTEFQGIDGMYSWGAINLTIGNNEVYGVTGVGIELNYGINITVVNNYLHYFVDSGLSSNGIWVCTANTLIANNTIENATGHGIAIAEPWKEGETDRSGINQFIINNTIKDTIGHGSNGDWAGIRILLSDRNKDNLAIINNTLIDNPWGIYFTSTGSGQLINSTITGNTIIGGQVPYWGVTPTNQTNNP